MGALCTKSINKKYKDNRYNPNNSIYYNNETLLVTINLIKNVNSDQNINIGIDFDYFTYYDSKINPILDSNYIDNYYKSIKNSQCDKEINNFVLLVEDLNKISFNNYDVTTDAYIKRLLKSSIQKPYNSWKMISKYLNIDYINSGKVTLEYDYYEFYRNCYEYFTESDHQTIVKDYNRTFTSHPFYRLQTYIFQTSIERLCKAVSSGCYYTYEAEGRKCLNPLGYMQGMSYVCAYSLVLAGDELQAFYFLRKLLMDLNLNLVYIEKFQFHHFYSEVFVRYWADAATSLFLSEYSNSKVHTITTLIFHNCGQTYDGFYPRWLMKFLNALFARDFAYEYLEIIYRWIVVKGIWRGLFRVIAVIHELFYEFLFLDKTWSQYQFLNSVETDAYKLITYMNFVSCYEQFELEAVVGCEGLMDDFSMIMQDFLNSCCDGPQAVFNYTRIFKSQAHFIDKLNACYLNFDHMDALIQSIFDRDVQAQRAGGVPLYDLVRQNLHIRPNDLHIDFTDPIDTRLYDSYLQNSTQEVEYKQTTSPVHQSAEKVYKVTVPRGSSLQKEDFDRFSHQMVNDPRMHKQIENIHPSRQPAYKQKQHKSTTRANTSKHSSKKSNRSKDSNKTFENVDIDTIEKQRDSDDPTDFERQFSRSREEVQTSVIILDRSSVKEEYKRPGSKTTEYSSQNHENSTDAESKITSYKCDTMHEDKLGFINENLEKLKNRLDTEYISEQDSEYNNSSRKDTTRDNYNTNVKNRNESSANRLSQIQETSDDIERNKIRDSLEMYHKQLEANLREEIYEEDL